MLRLHDLKVGSKLAVAFAAILLMTIGLGGFAILRLRTVNDQSTIIAESWLPSVRLSGQMVTGLGDIRRTQFRHLLSSTREEMEEARQMLLDYRGKLVKTNEAYQQLITSDEERRLHEQFVALWTRYREEVWPPVERESLAGNKAVATQMLMAPEAKRVFDDATARAEAIVALNQKGADAASKRGDEIYASARTYTVALLVVSVLVGVFFAVAITRAVAAPLRTMTEHMQRVAVGDIQQRVEFRSRDEVGALAESLRAIIASQQALAQGATRLAAGDTSVETKVRSDQDEVARAFGVLRDTMQRLVSEMDKLTQAGRDGQLATRGDAAQFQGDFRALVAGVNDTLDAVIRPVNEAAGVLERLAERDLTIRVTGDYKGDHARIKVSINGAAAALQAAMGEVAVATGQVASASQEIAGGSQQLAQGSSEQAASLEEVSSSLQELASMTQQNTGHAREAQSLVESARTSVNQGVEGIQRLSGAMDQIKASSDSTARIVKTIDEIAFQTNLLALNAAVEAARAGDAGKGFAVVAEEVRNLAMRSAEAAKQTATLIEESVRNAGHGVTLSSDVVTHLGEIHLRVNKVGEVMAEISAASDQQNQGVSQINVAVEQMNAVTQQVAASSEESASAAEELSSQAARMRDLVGQFHLGEEHDVAPATAAQAWGRRSMVPSASRGRSSRAPAPSFRTAAVGVSAKGAIPFDDDDSALGDF